MQYTMRDLFKCVGNWPTRTRILYAFSGIIQTYSINTRIYIMVLDKWCLIRLDNIPYPSYALPPCFLFRRRESLFAAFT